MTERVFGQRYKLLEKIGSGGMANVYKGEDQVLNRFVAIKILHEQFSTDESFIARFKQEAQSAANLTHPNIVNIFDWGTENSSYYIIMEYLKGQNLKDYIADAGHLTWQEACDIGIQVANALSFAHKNDVVHRDIKPHNIIVTRDGAVKVTDFGIARAGSSNMTQTGAILGTAHYIAPEQAKGQTADARSDLYSLGLVLYESIAGHAPFTGDNPVTIAMKHVQEEIPSIKEVNPNVPDSLIQILNKALAKSPEERYQTATELKQDLSAAMKGLPITAAVSSEQDTVIINKTPANNRTNRRSAPRPVQKKKKKLWPVATFIVAIVLVALLLSLIFANAGKKIEVPDITGATLSEAKTILKDKKLGLQVVSREFSENVNKGLVIEQDPESGYLLEEGKPVKIVLSKGIETTIVPSLYGKTQSEAEAALAEEGLNLGEVDYKESESEPGIVVWQSHRAGRQVSKDSAIDIQLSKEIAKVVVPSVIGRSKKNAIVILGTKSLKGSVVEQYDDDIDKGLVISQSPSAGVEVKKNSSVTIYVSKGPKVTTVTVPDVVGLSLEEATSEILAVGLKVSSAGSGSAVTAQSPAAGTQAEKSSLVTVTLGG